jgi:ABC-type sugar transport system substrate-binding protein
MIQKNERITRISLGARLVLLTRLVLCSQALTFAMVPKRVTSPFFAQADRGWQDAAKILNNTCICTGPLSPDEVVPEEQAKFISALIVNGTVDGMAISVSSEEIIAPLIDQAVDAGIPVVTFDSDAPHSKRSVYVGTDNTFLGTQIAKVLKQLQPEGGTFGVLSTPGANIEERENGFRYELLENSNHVWVEITGSPTSFQNHAEALNQTQDLADQNPTAIALMLEGPMKEDAWEPLVDSNSEKNIIYVAADGSDNQLDLLSRRKCQGLVGQLPYEMGFIAMQVLDELVRNQTIQQEIVGTNVVTHIQVPLVLPPLYVDENRLGGLAVVGYVLFGLVTLTAIGFIGWTYQSRKLQVVKASQPIFLIMVALGVLIMASSIIPLSFDDSTGHLGSTGICMSIPWLCFMGFSITFAALYSKTKRINEIMRSSESFIRVKVTPVT